jgi:hypothetical protein
MGADEEERVMRLNRVVLAMVGLLVGVGVASAQSADAPTVALIDRQRSGMKPHPPHLADLGASVSPTSVPRAARYSTRQNRTTTSVG